MSAAYHCVYVHVLIFSFEVLFLITLGSYAVFCNLLFSRYSRMCVHTGVSSSVMAGHGACYKRAIAD